ncbi:MAG TPA: DUF433 domain-containing protein [Chloroflexota bacterium]|nr:DUF433 domain-containing protein [Chloroflexota bacterium]
MAIAFRHLVRKPDGVTEIAGKGIRVCTLHALYEMGDTAERIADGYDLPLAAVLEALAYAADNPEEIEATNRADEEAGRQVMEQMPEPFRSRLQRTMAADDRKHDDLVRKVKEARRGTAVP